MSRCVLSLLVFSILLLPQPNLCAGASSLQRREFFLQRMGTQFRIVLYAANQDEASLAVHAAFDRVEHLEELLSDYRENSEVRRLCREAAGVPRHVSGELYHVLETSLRISRLTHGAFDVTAGPLVTLWREARRAKRMPDPQEVTKAREAVGYENIVLEAAAHTVRLKHKDMKFDLGGVARGFAADEALKVLASRGVRCAMVDAGGDLALGDAPPGEPGWRVAVHAPDSRPSRFGYLMLHNVGVATSGDAYWFLDRGGRRYSYLINPSNGAMITDSVSTTLIAPEAITADGLATALSILPVSEALKVADSVPGVSVSFSRRIDSWVRYFASGRFPSPEFGSQPPRSGPGRE